VTEYRFLYTDGTWNYYGNAIDRTNMPCFRSVSGQLLEGPTSGLTLLKRPSPAK
jgi:hypothetical protein